MVDAGARLLRAAANYVSARGANLTRLDIAEWQSSSLCIIFVREQPNLDGEHGRFGVAAVN